MKNGSRDEFPSHLLLIALYKIMDGFKSHLHNDYYPYCRILLCKGLCKEKALSTHFHIANEKAFLLVPWNQSEPSYI